MPKEIILSFIDIILYIHYYIYIYIIYLIYFNNNYCCGPRSITSLTSLFIHTRRFHHGVCRGNGYGNVFTEPFQYCLRQHVESRRRAPRALRPVLVSLTVATTSAKNSAKTCTNMYHYIYIYTYIYIYYIYIILYIHYYIYTLYI